MVNLKKPLGQIRLIVNRRPQGRKKREGKNNVGKNKSYKKG